MPKYKYKARDKQGKLIVGEINASDLNNGRSILLQNGLIIIEIKKSFDVKLDLIKKISVFKPKVSLEEQLMFNRQLQLIYSVRMPILKGLQFIFDQTENSILKGVVKSCMADISEGKEFNYALAKYPDIFDKSFIGLIKAGEMSGELEAIFDRICEITEIKAENRTKIKSALFYPKLVIIFIGFIFVIVVFVIIPKMKGFYDNFKIDLPFVTQLMIKFSSMLMSPYFIILELVISGLFFYYFATIKEIFKKYWYKFSFRMPFIGLLLLQIEMNSFCKILELLLKSGMTLVQSLKIVKETTTNEVIADEITQAVVSVESGKSIKTALQECKNFPPLVVNMISVGEETGSIEVVLNKIASYYRLQIDYKISNLTKMLEPLFLILIFTIVLILALSVFMPMWRMSMAVKRV
ncbi:MAG: type II secretion system F family protein [Oligoflexia bacterium]|nr:type II secretion system F family protein [Oligoflexia bacterium]